MPRLLIVHHGDTAYNVNRRFMGQSDIELSEFGTGQIEQLRDYIAGEKIAAVFTSDLKRTMKTASIIAAGRGLEITLCPELREVNYGECEGLSFKQISERYPGVAERCITFTLDLSFPRGEDYRTFIKRTRGFVKRLKNYSPKDTVLVVSHSGPIKVLLCHFLGLVMKYSQRLHLDTGSLSIVHYNPPNISLIKYNDTSYLTKAGRT